MLQFANCSLQFKHNNMILQVFQVMIGRSTKIKPFFKAIFIIIKKFNLILERMTIVIRLCLKKMKRLPFSLKENRRSHFKICTFSIKPKPFFC